MPHNLDDDVIEKLKGVEGIVTPLFDPQNLESKEKINTIIRENFMGTLDDVPEELSAYVNILSLTDMIDFRVVGFDKGIKTAGSVIREFVSIQSDKFESDTVGNLCAINPSKEELEDISRDTKVSFIDMASLSDEGYIERRDERSLAEVESGSYKYFRENDFILAKITPCMENGKCAIATDLKNGIGFGSSEYHVFRCGDRILPEYLYYLVNREEIRIEAVKHMTGVSGHRRVPVDFYEKMRIPVPPISVQKEMVRDFEKYVQEIRQEEARLYELNEQVKSRFVELFGDGEQVDKPFPSVRLGTLCEIARGGSPRPIDKYITTDEDGINWIKIGDANSNSRYITRTEEKIIPEGMKKSRYVKSGDFILSNSMSFGHPYILRIDGCIHDGWLLLRFDRSHLNELYLYEYLCLPSVFRKMTEMSAGMVVSNLNSEVVKELPILLPPLSLQNEFAAYVESVDKLRFATEEKIKELKKEKEQMIDKYFR